MPAQDITFNLNELYALIGVFGAITVAAVAYLQLTLNSRFSRELGKIREDMHHSHVDIVRDLKAEFATKERLDSKLEVITQRIGLLEKHLERRVA